jgi:hypothetical protein
VTDFGTPALQGREVHGQLRTKDEPRQVPQDARHAAPRLLGAARLPNRPRPPGGPCGPATSFSGTGHGKSIAFPTGRRESRSLAVDAAWGPHNVLGRPDGQKPVRGPHRRPRGRPPERPEHPEARHRPPEIPPHPRHGRPEILPRAFGGSVWNGLKGDGVDADGADEPCPSRLPDRRIVPSAPMAGGISMLRRRGIRRPRRRQPSAPSPTSRPGIGRFLRRGARRPRMRLPPRHLRVFGLIGKNRARRKPTRRIPGSFRAPRVRSGARKTPRRRWRAPMRVPGKVPGARPGRRSIRRSFIP